MAIYGDFEYDENVDLSLGHRQQLLQEEDDNKENDENVETASATNNRETNGKLLDNDDDEEGDKEPWMLDQVEEYISRLDEIMKRRRSTSETLVYSNNAWFSIVTYSWFILGMGYT